MHYSTEGRPNLRRCKTKSCTKILQYCIGHLDIILPPTSGSSKWYLPQISQPKLYMYFLSPYVLHITPISLIWVPETLTNIGGCCG